MKVFLDTNIFLEYFEQRREYQAVSISHKHLATGVNDLAFDDVEDSFQYQSALQAKCDALVTINLRDYSAADTSTIEILSPTEFVAKYL
jgi:predicted nucleic acid-binding protein